MNDFIAAALVSTICLVGLVCFVLFHIYRGLNDSLITARIGSVYNFEYEQPVTGDPERFMAKVISVHRLSNDSIARLNATSRYRRHDGQFVRTHHLVTCQTFDGKIRQFYAERATNVRRFPMGDVLMKTGVASLLF